MGLSARPPMQAGAGCCSVLLTPSHPGHTRHLTNSAALRRMGPGPSASPGFWARLQPYLPPTEKSDTA